MAKREEFKIGDEIQFLRPDPTKKFREDSIYTGIICFIPSCRKSVLVWPHNFPAIIDPFSKQEINGELTVEGSMFTPQCAAGKKL